MQQVGTSGSGTLLSIAEQAMLLLDILPSILNRKKLENFRSLDPEINASLRGGLPLPTPADETGKNPYSVASRMGRTNYEEQAKAEALLHALRQMRARNAANPAHTPRVLRGT